MTNIGQSDHMKLYKTPDHEVIYLSIYLSMYIYIFIYLFIICWYKSRETMPTSKTYTIILIVVIVAAGLGIFFMTSSK